MNKVVVLNVADPKILNIDLVRVPLMIIIIFIYCDWVVTRWQWLFYVYTKYEIGY